MERQKQKVMGENTPNPKQVMTIGSLRGWGLWLTLLMASFILAFIPVWKSLILTWYDNDEYSHGFLVLPIFFYMVLQKREALASVSIRSTPWGIIIVIVSLLLYAIGHIGEIQTVASFSMVMTLVGATLYLYGWPVFKLMAFPLFLLLFMIPVPAQIYSTLTIPLQLFVSKISAAISFSFGVPIFREGNVLFLPGQTLEVVQACSGLRSMMSLMMLTAVFGYLSLSSNLSRLMLFLFSVPAAIIVNVVRVSVMVFAFHLFNYDLTEGTAHTLFGLLIFLLSLALVVGMKGVLSRWER